MKKFVSKLMLFLIMYLVLEAMISFFVPYHWGSPWYSTKIQYLKKERKTDLPTTFFFGSSIVYRQINPQVFDSLYYDLSHEKVNSFNLGAPATFCPQTYFLYENFLRSSISKKAKYVIMELTDINMLDKNLLHQERTTYWQNLSDVLFVLTSVYGNRKISPFVRYKFTYNYIVAYLENIFHIGHYGQELMEKNYYNENYIGPMKNGFFPLEYELVITENEVVKDHLSKRLDNLKVDSLTLVKRAKESVQSLKKVTKDIDYIHLNRISKLIDLSKKQGIKLIFLLGTKRSSQDMVNLYHLIPNKNKIQLTNAEDYPQLYSFEHSFDAGHLNTKGAYFYSSYLAKELYKISK